MSLMNIALVQLEMNEYRSFDIAFRPSHVAQHLFLVPLWIGFRTVH